MKEEQIGGVRRNQSDGSKFTEPFPNTVTLSKQ